MSQVTLRMRWNLWRMERRLKRSIKICNKIERRYNLRDHEKTIDRH